jgi:hypothetical protein
MTSSCELFCRLLKSTKSMLAGISASSRARLPCLLRPMKKMRPAVPAALAAQAALAPLALPVAQLPLAVQAPMPLKGRTALIVMQATAPEVPAMGSRKRAATKGAGQPSHPEAEMAVVSLFRPVHLSSHITTQTQDARLAVAVAAEAVAEAVAVVAVGARPEMRSQASSQHCVLHCSNSWDGRWLIRPTGLRLCASRKAVTCSFYLCCGSHTAPAAPLSPIHAHLRLCCRRA